MKSNETTVLVIDDEKNLLDSIIDLLEINDFNVLAAQGGLEALEMIENRMPDIILCDIMMPHMNGYIFLQELRRNPLAVGVPFIFLSAKSDKQDIRRGMDLMADDYLTKPFTHEELISSITARMARIDVLKREIMMFMQNINHSIETVHSNLTSSPISNELETVKAMLKSQNEAIEKYCHINSHKVRGPLCRIMGLLELFNEQDNGYNKEILTHLKTSASDLDKITKEISYAIATTTRTSA